MSYHMNREEFDQAIIDKNCEFIWAAYQYAVDYNSLAEADMMAWENTLPSPSITLWIDFLPFKVDEEDLYHWQDVDSYMSGIPYFGPNQL